jgi:hypothetical protein
MADISMCSGIMYGNKEINEIALCPQRHNCYRFLAKPSKHQLFLLADLTQLGKCEHYWEVIDEVR